MLICPIQCFDFAPEASRCCSQLRVSVSVGKRERPGQQAQMYSQYRQAPPLAPNDAFPDDFRATSCTLTAMAHLFLRCDYDSELKTCLKQRMMLWRHD